MITYRYNLNREPRIKNDRYNHDKINPWFNSVFDQAFSRKRVRSRIHAVFQALS